MELGEREREALPVPPRLEAAKVEPQRTRVDDLLFAAPFRLLAQPRAAQQRFDAREELAQRERFAEVIVGSELEPQNAIELLVFRREDQDREMLAARAQAAAELEAVEARHDDVEDGEVRQRALEPRQRLRAVGKRLDAETIALQCHRYRRAEAFLIVDERDQCSRCRAHDANLLQNTWPIASATKSPQLASKTPRPLRSIEMSRAHLVA
jgi:hypothetical protein